jgi:hypothetical protein
MLGAGKQLEPEVSRATERLNASIVAGGAGAAKADDVL